MSDAVSQNSSFQVLFDFQKHNTGVTDNHLNPFQNAKFMLSVLTLGPPLQQSLLNYLSFSSVCRPNTFYVESSSLVSQDIQHAKILKATFTNIQHAKIFLAGFHKHLHAKILKADFNKHLTCENIIGRLSQTFSMRKYYQQAFTNIQHEKILKAGFHKNLACEDIKGRL